MLPTLDIAASYWLDMDRIYVNERNAARYKIDVEHDEFLELHLMDLRKEKAFQLVWKFIAHNMKRWWD